MDPGSGECWDPADDLNPINVSLGVASSSEGLYPWKQERPLGHSSLLSRADNDVNSE